MPDTNWMLRVESELGGIKEAMKNFGGFRSDVIDKLDKQGDKMDEQGAKLDKMGGQLRNVETTLTSTSTTVSSMARDNLSERLTKVEARIDAFGVIENEVVFWRKLLGGTFRAVWKIIALLVGSGAVGALVVKYWPFH